MKGARIAIFASGAGSNARQIITCLRSSDSIDVACVLSNKNESGAIVIGAEQQVPTYIFNKDELSNSNGVLRILQSHEVTHVVLAGFLWLIPAVLIHAFPNRIINIHPALLPKFGGKGMFGQYVHAAVKNAGEKKTGITIHLVNELYDEGKYLFQKECILTGNESIVEIASKVQALEHKYYPKVIEKWIENGSAELIDFSL